MPCLALSGLALPAGFGIIKREDSHRPNLFSFTHTHPYFHFTPTELLSEDPEQWWRCPHCQNRYDVDRIEQLLVESVQRTLTRYALQDVRCLKCRRVNTLAMAETCRCAGKLVGDEAPEEFATLLGTLRRVATHFGLAYLKETIDFALRIDPEEEAAAAAAAAAAHEGELEGVAAQLEQQQLLESN